MKCCSIVKVKFGVHNHNHNHKLNKSFLFVCIYINLNLEIRKFKFIILYPKNVNNIFLVHILKINYDLNQTFHFMGILKLI